MAFDQDESNQFESHCADSIIENTGPGQEIFREADSKYSLLNAGREGLGRNSKWRAKK